MFFPGGVLHASQEGYVSAYINLCSPVVATASFEFKVLDTFGAVKVRSKPRKGFEEMLPHGMRWLC